MGVAAFSGGRKAAHPVLPFVSEPPALQHHLEVKLDHPRGTAGHPQPSSLRGIQHRVSRSRSVGRFTSIRLSHQDSFLALIMGSKSCSERWWVCWRAAETEAVACRRQVRGGGGAGGGESQRASSGVRGHQRDGLPCLHLPHAPCPAWVLYTLHHPSTLTSPPHTHAHAHAHSTLYLTPQWSTAELRMTYLHLHLHTESLTWHWVIPESVSRAYPSYAPPSCLHTLHDCPLKTDSVLTFQLLGRREFPPFPSRLIRPRRPSAGSVRCDATQTFNTCVDAEAPRCRHRHSHGTNFLMEPCKLSTS